MYTLFVNGYDVARFTEKKNAYSRLKESGSNAYLVWYKYIYNAYGAYSHIERYEYQYKNGKLTKKRIR